MADLAPTPQTPPPPPVPPGGGYLVKPIGRPPEKLGGAFYSTGLVILLMIVTLGLWGALWTYRTSEDLKRYNGDGLGGVRGVVIYLLLNIVLMVTIPNEIAKLYERDGHQSPVSAVWGLWLLLPFIGNLIWYVRVQRSLNEFWMSKGSRPG